MTTYAEQETSVEASAPLELYQFIRIDSPTQTTKWCYANNESDVTFGGDLYEGTPGIKRSNITQNNEDTTMQLTVDLPRSACVTDELIGLISPTPIRFNIFRLQRGVADSDFATIFSGEISGSVFEGSLCTISGTTEETQWNNTMVRLTCQRSCPHMLYDDFCGADQDAATFALTITDISDDLQTITVGEPTTDVDHLTAGSHFYKTGFVTYQGRNVFVIDQNTNVLTLQTPLLGAVAGDSLTGTAGCNRTTADCIALHDNIQRYGGFTLIPIVSPWAGLT